LKLPSYNIPKEVIDALTGPRGFRLLIKGEPGTGKTIFALTLCKILKNSHVPFYITVRTTPDELYADYPFIKEVLSPNNILDAVRTTVTAPEEIAIEFRFSEKPAFLQQLYSLIKKTEKHVTIIIDSLEALKSNLDVPINDFSLEEAILEISRDTTNHVVFVSETMGITPLDYIVDGIIELTRSKNGRLIRYMKITKIRGKEIENPYPIFTLANGEFKTLHIQKLSFYDEIVLLGLEKFNKVENSENSISTGIKYLDNILGEGYQAGTLNIIEIRREVGDRHDYIYFLTVINQILNEKTTVIVPPAGIPAKNFENMLRKLTPKTPPEKFNEIIRLVEFGGKNLNEEGHESHILCLEGEDVHKDYRKIRSAISEIESLGKPTLIVMGLDTLQQVYGVDELLSIIGPLVMDAKQAGNVLICLVKYGQKVIEALNHLADVHLVVDAYEGTVLTYGVIPYTPNLHPNIHVEEGKYEVKLTPIV